MTPTVMQYFFAQRLLLPASGILLTLAFKIDYEQLAPLFKKIKQKNWKGEGKRERKNTKTTKPKRKQIT